MRIHKIYRASFGGVGRVIVLAPPDGEGGEGVGRGVEEGGIVDGEEGGPVLPENVLLSYFRRTGKVYDSLEGH